MEALQGLKQMVTVTELDDFLQCPVCYEVPAGHIYQCNEGHHVCVTCKRRLDRCPVCRAMFFGTRNYALEELISNIRKMKLAKSQAAEQAQRNGASSSGTPSTVSTDSTPGSTDTDRTESSSESRPPPVMCSGLFRCLCCNSTRKERLPVARMLNHLRYWHSLDLIEGKLEGEQYEQIWQIPMDPGRVVLAVRVVELGIFFLVIEIQSSNFDVQLQPIELHSWLSMVASPLEADNFHYNLTFTATDREATFADTVMSVRSCEGQLKKRRRCLTLDHANMPAFHESRIVSVRLCIKRVTERREEVREPRAMVRIANRSSSDAGSDIDNQHQRRQPPHAAQVNSARAQPQTNVARAQPQAQRTADTETVVARIGHLRVATPEPEPAPADAQLSRNARRRLRRRLARSAQAPPPPATAPPASQADVAQPARNRSANLRR